VRDVTLLGASELPPFRAATALLDVRYENGREILRLGWSGDHLTSTMIGPPYPSRLRLAACADGRYVGFDLRASRVVAELKAGQDPASDLVLAVGGKSVALRRAKR
jgi:hypothetical protein